MTRNFKHILQILLLLSTICTSTLFANNLITGRKSSYLTYIYKLTDNDARKIYRQNTLRVDTNSLHTLVDSYPTDSIYQKKLSPGHYIESFVQKNTQVYNYIFVPNFEVKILNNNTDLCIQVLKSDGSEIHNAKIHLGWSNVPYDTITHCYIRKRTSKDGILEVKVNGITAYYQLKKNIKLTPFVRSAERFVYRIPPFNFIALPLRFLVRLPADAVESIQRESPCGVVDLAIWNITHPLTTLRYMLIPYSNFPYSGYLVFNKPKYFPGDTVKFKAYILKSGKPLKKALKINIKLMYDDKTTTIATLKPYSPGAYEYTFKLTDSLNLKLDKEYVISLDKRKFPLISSNFKYEQYELNPLHLTINTETDKQYRGIPKTLKIKGSDDNDLDLMDARVEVKLITKNVNQLFDKSTFIPDTLYTITEKLNPFGEASVTFSDSIFPKANLVYTAQVRLLNSDNKTISQSKELNFYHNSSDIDFKILSDSMEVTYKENGMPKQKQVGIYATDFFGNKVFIKSQATPCRTVINTSYNKYMAEVDTIKRTFEMGKEESMLSCTTNRTKDSLFIQINNPRKLRFTYNLYKRNTETDRGCGSSLNIARKINTKENYYLSFRYLWAGSISEKTIRIVYYDKKLNVKLIEPEQIYPGQKINIGIEVTDQKGKPVEGVDLTALAFTKKFDAEPQIIPYIGKKMPSKQIVNNFRFNSKKDMEQATERLDYSKWKKIARIDSIEFYKFLYPGDTIYRYEYPAEGNNTQFSPFIVSKNGNFEPIHIIYIDNKPIYFSWTKSDNPYSFRIDSLPHQITLRTKLREIRINNMRFRNGYKTIFSLPLNIKDNSITVTPVSNYANQQELYTIYKYTLKYKNNFGSNIAYINNEKSLLLLNNVSDKSYERQNEAGPINWNAKLKVTGNYSNAIFNRFENRFEFLQDSIIINDYFSKYMNFSYLSMNTTEQNFSDSVLTINSINKLREQVGKEQRLKFHPNQSINKSVSYGNLRLTKHLKPFKKDTVLNRILLRYDTDEFIRLYSGYENNMLNLQPGKYQLISLNNGFSYSINDSIEIKKNGNTFIDVDNSVIKKDSFSTEINKLIDVIIFKDKITNKDMILLQQCYLRNFKSIGESKIIGGKTITGKITDKITKKPLVGASITIKGTNYGSVTDNDGNYALTIPNTTNQIKISCFGYYTQVAYLNALKNDIELNKNFNDSTQEIGLVWGYYEKERSFASQTIGRQEYTSVDDALEGKISGLDVVGNSGSIGMDLTIPDISTTESTKPLILIDGQVYSGDINKVDKSSIAKIEMLNGEKATSLYGNLAANGVVVITTKEYSLKIKSEKQGKQFNSDIDLSEGASMSKSLRNNFSDYAFWKPRLQTNKEGKATFEVTFPDDVTKWETNVFAMNGKRQSGQTMGEIKSYKPLMAELSVPNFLVENDSAIVIGKALNYSSDSTKIRTVFNVNGKNSLERLHTCSNSTLDSLMVVAPADSLQLSYSLSKFDGYMDGESKKVQTYPVGIEETEGKFFVLENDTTFTPEFNASINDVTLFADADYLDVMDKEINSVLNYNFYCNEQIASKLKVLLAKKLLTKHKGKGFYQNDEINRMIRLLLKSRKDNGLWGWWSDTETHYQFSQHILEALASAKQQGFKVNIDETNLSRQITLELDNLSGQSNDTRIALLKASIVFNAVINYAEQIHKLDKTNTLSLTQKLELTEIKQMCKLSYNTDLLKTMKKKNIIGNTYFSDNESVRSITKNDIKNTLLAYRIIRNEKSDNLDELASIRRYFLEKKQNNSVWNTYESAQIVETLLPDLIKSKPSWKQSSLKITGDITKTVTNFPFEMKLKSGQKISVTKTGKDPIYFTTYQRHFNKSPRTKTSEFKITTQFSNQSSTGLKAGQAVKLIVNLEVLNNADYLMIRVPIPAGCSYGQKTQPRTNEVHREYFKNETIIFCQKLQKGEYNFEINLQPRFLGKYTLNPAKVELMYFPIFNANNEIKKLNIY